MLDPIGFWSYTRHDDAHSDGELSQLRVLVGKAMGLQTGAEVKLWQDITAIPFGADWADEIARTIGKTSFFMPIVTPRFLKSRNCFEEFEQFRNRMRALGRDDLVFPVHYVNVEGVHAEDTVFGDSLAALRRHQWIDFRPLFYADPRSREVRRWAGDLAASILEALARPADHGAGARSALPDEAARRPPRETASQSSGEAAAASVPTDVAPAVRTAAERAAPLPLAASSSSVAGGGEPPPSLAHHASGVGTCEVRTSDTAGEDPRPRRRIGAISAMLLAAAAGVAALVAMTRSGTAPPTAVSADTSAGPEVAASPPSPAKTPPASTTSSRTRRPKDTFRECADGCPQVTVVPAGRFIMGSPDGEAGRYPQEGPQRTVTIAGPLAVSTYAVTFDDWDACAARGDCRKDVSDSGWGRGRRPVINVSWDDARTYAAWLSRTTGQPYRLLSEAEYEYVARAGAGTAYPWGSAVGTGNADCDGCGSTWDNRRTAPVGSFAPNAFGLFDVAGNVWSWVEDCWHDTYDRAPNDGSAWTGRNCSRRVVRGGGWSSNPRYLRAAARSRSLPGNRRDYTGFRVGHTLAP